MEFKGTQGPWHCKEFHGNFIVVDEQKNVVNVNQNNANALLISEAPEMLNLLETMVSDFENTSKSSSDILMKSLGKAKELIKSATQI